MSVTQSKSRPPLAAAILRGAPPDEIRHLLASGANPDQGSGKHHSPPLHLATRHPDSLRVMQALVAAGAGISAQDDRGWNVLHQMVHTQAPVACVAWLIGQGVAATQPDAKGRPPLHAALAAGRPDLARALLQAGAVPAQAPPLALALAQTPEAALPETLDLLRRLSTEVRAADARGRTPLHAMAARSLTTADRQVAFMQALLDQGADPSARTVDGLTPAQEAIKSPHASSALECLHAAGADLIEADATTPPLHRAAAMGKLRAAQALGWMLAQGVPADLRDGEGRTPAHVAATAAASGNLSVLLAHDPALAHARDARGRTPLACAIEARAAAAARILLDAGAPADAEDLVGETPLFGLCRAWSQATSFSRSASSEKWEQVITRMVEAGADPDHCAADGDGLLHRLAAFRNRPCAALVGMLLAAGATLDLRDASGRTPMDIATAAGAEDTVFCLARAIAARDQAALAAGARPRPRRLA